MENNKSVIGRQLLCIDEKKVDGRVIELRIDCDDMKIAHLLTKEVAVPFDKIIGIGDTFVTMQTGKDLLRNAESRNIFMQGNKLIGSMVYTRMGNALSGVAAYEFDAETGDIMNITLEDETKYPRETFVFFHPDFVLLDLDKVQEAEEAAGLTDVEPSEEEAELMKELIGKQTTMKVVSADGYITIQKGATLTEALVNNAFKHGALTELSFAI